MNQRMPLGPLREKLLLSWRCPCSFVGALLRLSMGSFRRQEEPFLALKNDFNTRYTSWKGCSSNSFGGMSCYHIVREFVGDSGRCAIASLRGMRPLCNCIKPSSGFQSKTFKCKWVRMTHCYPPLGFLDLWIGLWLSEYHAPQRDKLVKAQ